MKINFEDIKLGDLIRGTYYDGSVYVTRDGRVTLVTSHGAYASGSVIAAPNYDAIYLLERKYV